MWSSLSWIGCCPASTHSPWPNNHGMAPVILNSLGISQVLFGNQYFNLATIHWCLLDEIYLCSLTTSWRSFLESPSTDEHLIKFYSQEDSRNTVPFPLPKRINSAFTFLECLSIAHLCQASQVGRLYEHFDEKERYQEELAAGEVKPKQIWALCKFKTFAFSFGKAWTHAWGLCRIIGRH